MKRIFFALCVLLLPVLAHAEPAQTIPAPATTVPSAPHEVIVKWKESLRSENPERLLQRSAQHRHTLRAHQPELKQHNTKRHFSVVRSDFLSTEELIEQFERLPEVEYVHENVLFQAQAQTTPWGVDNTAGVQAQSANDSGYTGNGVVVAVVDSGALLTHEDLDDNLWTPTGNTCTLNGSVSSGGCPNHGYDFVNTDNDPTDDNGHGTHVAGTIAAEDNDIGVVGVAPQAAIMVVKVLDANGSGTYADIIEGIDFAVDNGADVINMSLGAFSGGAVLQDMQDAIADAEATGVVVAAATGNSASPVAFVPSMFESVISVGAVQETATANNPDANYNTRLAFFSNWGKVTLVAPGAGVLSTYNDGSYATENGTSMASPHVAGVVALLKQKRSSLTPSQIRAILETTSTDFGTTGKDEFFGSGLVNAVAALNKTDDSSTKTMVLEGNWSNNSSTAYETFYYLDPTIYSVFLPADASSTTLVRIRVVTEDGDPVSAESVSLAVTAGSITTTNPATTNSSGVAEFTIRAPGSAGTATATATLNGTGATKTIGMRFADTLLVSDTGQPTYASTAGWYVYQALEASDTNWNMSRFAYPSSESTLSAYPSVVWHTDRYSVTDEEQNLLKEYLDAGGNLFLFGGDILYTLNYYSTVANNPTFGTDIIFTPYLKVAFADYVSPNTSFIGDGALEGVGATLPSGTAATTFPYSDVVTALSGAVSVGYYCSNTNSGAVSVESTYRSLFLGVALEYADKTEREEAIDNALRFLTDASPAGGTFSTPASCDSSATTNDGSVEDNTSSDGDTPVPGIPEDSVAVADPVITDVVSETTDTSALFTWATTETIDSALIYAENIATQETESSATAEATGGIVEGLTPNTQYSFHIYGVYEDGSMTPATDVEATTIPGPPTTPVLEKNGRTSVTLLLSDPTETGFQFEVELADEDFKPLLNTVLESGDDSIVITNMEPDTAYTARARLMYVDGETDEDVDGVYSEYLEFSTYAERVKKPTVVKRRGTEVKVEWKKLSAEKLKKYVLQVFELQGNAYVEVQKIRVQTKLEKNTKQRWIRGLTSRVQYRFRVRAVFKNGDNGTYSRYQTFKTKAE